MIRQLADHLSEAARLQGGRGNSPQSKPVSSQQYSVGNSRSSISGFQTIARRAFIIVVAHAIPRYILLVEHKVYSFF